MKSFDVLEIRAARTLAEADFYWKQKQGIAVRQEAFENFRERTKRVVNRVIFKEGKL